MAGVAGPMLRSDRRAGVRLLAGLLAGELAAGVLLAVPAYLLSKGLHATLSQPARLWLLAAVCLVFGAADMANRTPRVQRQVPEALLHRLPPGTVGVVWGFDLGLLFTTQKAVSLIWVAIAAGILLDPVSAAAIVAGIAAFAALTVTGLSIARRPGVDRVSRWASSLRLARQGSGVLLIGLFVLTAVRAWHA